jgi:hypothetical protein
MADLYGSRALVRLNDGTADANNAGVVNAAPGASDYALEVRQVGLPAAAVLADAAANPTLTGIGSYLIGYNGTTWDRLRSTTANGLAVDVTRVTGTVTVDTELAAAAAQADAVANPTIPNVGAFLSGYNGTTWDRLRSSTANGLVVDVSRVQGTVTADTELPAAAALADAAANPTSPIVGDALLSFNGTTWDRSRNIAASDGNSALTTTGILATGVGPGFSRRFNPANLGTAANSASAADINGAGTASVGIGTTTSGTFTFEVSSDSSNWVAAIAYDVATGTFVTGTNLTPTLGKVYLLSTTGMRQMRLRTVSTLGATMVHTITLALGDGLVTNPPVSNASVNLTQVNGSTIAIGQAAMAASLPVVIASNQTSLTVDTELTAVSTLADATANPTISNIAALGFVFNGTTWDRARGAATLADALANPGLGLAQGQSFLMGYNGTTWDRVRTANTGRLQVDVVTGGGSNASVLVDNAGFTDGTSSVTAMGGYFDETAGTALTENDIAAVRIDSKRAQIAVLEDATTRGQRLAISAAGRMSVDLTGVGGSALAFGQGAMAASIPVVIASNQTAVTVDSELPAAAALTDAFANPTAPGVGAFLMGWNSTTWDRLKSTTANGLVVDVSRVQGTVTVDSELPTAAALADAVANPTVPAVGSYLVGFNGTTWDRVRTANTGRLQVDVISGGGAGPASGVPTGYNLIGLYGTSAAVAGGATQTAVVTNTPANTKAFYVKSVVVTASGQTKYQVKFGGTVLATGFNPQTNLTGEIMFDPPLTGTGDGSTALTVDVTNREASAMDVYAGLRGWVLA